MQENINLRLYLLKILLDRTKYERLNKLINDSFFDNGAKDLYTVIKNIYDNDLQKQSINLTELEASYFEVYFVNHSHSAKQNIQKLIDKLKMIPELSDSVVNNVISSMYKVSKADELAKICFDISNRPTDNSFSQVHKFLENIDEENLGQTGLVPVTKDIREVLKNSEQQGEFHFNLHSLERATNGIGRGNFMIIFARPETGKTAFWVSMVASPNGFAWQKKNVHIFANEEPAIRTQTRMINASTSMPKDVINKGGLDKAEAKWDEVKDYINIYDCVDKNIDDLNVHCEEHDVDILIIDQLDKINVAGKYNSSHEKLREIYRQAREIAKRHNVLVVGVSQASAEGHGRERLSFNFMENSKTGKAAEADIIIGVGKTDDGGVENVAEGCDRFITISKNKLTGIHDEFRSVLFPIISQYTERT